MNNNQRIVDYAILTGTIRDIVRIESEIRAHIREGWQPHGSPGLASNGSNVYMHQAMVKYEKLRTTPPRPTPNPTRTR